MSRVLNDMGGMVSSVKPPRLGLSTFKSAYPQLSNRDISNSDAKNGQLSDYRANQTENSFINNGMNINQGASGNNSVIVSKKAIFTKQKT